MDELLAGARGFTLQLRQVIIGEIVREVCALVQRQADFQDVTITVDGPADLQWSLDSQRFRQVLLNLLLNALHAQPQGGWITITFAEAELRVADGGPGVPEDLIATIFDPFVSEREGGTGLGLHLRSKLRRHIRLRSVTMGLRSAGDSPQNARKFLSEQA